MEQFISKAATLVEALPYLQKYRGKIFVFKYGGHAMTDPALRESFLRDVILLKHVGIHPVIVHGGGPQIEDHLKKLGVESQYANGLRVTDDTTMNVVEMVLVGQVNSELVNLIHKLDGLAVGFSGTDGLMIRARRMPTQKVKNESGQVVEVDLGRVGDIESVDPSLLQRLIGEDLFIPVISPIGIGRDGKSLNINADNAACEIAKALKAEKLILMTDVDGLLDEKGQLIRESSAKHIEELIDSNVIRGGMIPKVKSALDAVAQGVGSVTIIDGRVKHAVLLEVFTNQGLGTLIR